MEQTFVDSFLEHERHGQFRVGRANKHAVLCSLHVVNKAHDNKVTTAWVISHVKKLQERYEVFNWLIQRSDVVWNHNMKFVTAVDSVWEEICAPVPNEDVVVQVAPALPPILAEQGVLEELIVVEVDDTPVHNDGLILVPAIMVSILSDSSDSTSSFWRVIEEYYTSNSDSDCVLSLPGVPSMGPKAAGTGDESPNSHSLGPASSTASNATPLIKGHDITGLHFTFWHVVYFG
ncbi:UNVERIFIED_CONTAM: hypothetical protein Sangu_3027800 [Sesamum angustifolium]|uniref:Myb/SANT-like domain-containing protein n=1 Tax=Sesamum angustifolium TaxID=2727405 RepID=A0AAW2KM16_9LAMI